jgi:hypothetical protein
MAASTNPDELAIVAVDEATNEKLRMRKKMSTPASMITIPYGKIMW